MPHQLLRRQNREATDQLPLQIRIAVDDSCRAQGFKLSVPDQPLRVSAGSPQKAFSVLRNGDFPKPLAHSADIRLDAVAAFRRIPRRGNGCVAGQQHIQHRARKAGNRLRHRLPGRDRAETGTVPELLHGFPVKMVDVFHIEVIVDSVREIAVARGVRHLHADQAAGIQVPLQTHGRRGRIPEVFENVRYDQQIEPQAGRKLLEGGTDRPHAERTHEFDAFLRSVHAVQVPESMLPQNPELTAFAAADIRDGHLLAQEGAQKFQQSHVTLPVGF